MSWAPLVLLGLVAGASAVGDADKVSNLPGLLFKPTFDTYSGYLNANNSDPSFQMHYCGGFLIWLSRVRAPHRASLLFCFSRHCSARNLYCGLTESRTDAAKDPILVWFNGGPGCSSFSGMFEELGPFYVTKDGKQLFENIHSWNQKANVLALESPIGVGFSYKKGDAAFVQASDDGTADQNYAALKDFFKRVQTKYAGRDFYLSGESYAGVYIPTLSKLLVDGIMSGDFPNKNFKGFAIGNGFMHVAKRMNSLVLWSYYHGRLGMEQWETVKQQCCAGVGNVDYCKFSDHFVSKNGMDYVSDGSACGNLTAPLLIVDDNMDLNNYYQDCYPDSVVAVSETSRSLLRHRRAIRYRTRSENPADTHWQDSTDSQQGYPCWNGAAVQKYANRIDVWDAIHIPQEYRDLKKAWIGCSDPMYDQYQIKYITTDDLFDYVIKTYNQTLKILIYNGDVDLACNWLGDAWLMRDVANKAGMKITLEHQQWYYRNQTAGYVQRYAKADNSMFIDVVSVKGAGHLVPTDRPGQSAQMITNFMFSSTTNGGPNYNDASLVNPVPAPLPLVDQPTTEKCGGSERFVLFALIFTVVHRVFM